MNRPHIETVYATNKDHVLCSHQATNCHDISPCNHDEADTRIIMHASDAAKKGSQKLLIRTVDLAVAYVGRLDGLQLCTVVSWRRGRENICIKWS